MIVATAENEQVEATMTWFNRFTTGIVPSPAQRTASELLTMAVDHSARMGAPVGLPIAPRELVR